MTRPNPCEEAVRNRARVQSVEGSHLLGQHRQRAEGPWSYAKLYGGLARLGPRGLSNAIKKALMQGIGWNIMRLIAKLTGLRPRGWSQMALASPGAARVSAWTVRVASAALLGAALSGKCARRDRACPALPALLACLPWFRDETGRAFSQGC